jgi:uncharacterized membrane protein YecN with MAPEG domain
MLVELSGAQQVIVHGLCLCLLIGRAVHAYGVSKRQENFRYRVLGMALTFTALLSSAFALLVLGAGRLSG